MKKLTLLTALSTTILLTGCNVTVETNTHEFDPEIVATGSSDWVFNPKTRQYEPRERVFSTTIKPQTFELPETF